MNLEEGTDKKIKGVSTKFAFKSTASIAMDTDKGVISIAPYQYIHILDSNTNVTRVVTGPQRYTRNGSETIVAGPLEMIKVPPRRYVLILNPHSRDEKGQAEFDEFGQTLLRHGDSEYRMADEWPAPFPLYPGEVQVGKVEQLEVVEKNNALRLQAKRNFTEVVQGKPLRREAGEEWMFLGPATFVPRVEVARIAKITAQVIKPNQALHLRALRAGIDATGTERQAGEEWLFLESGAYMPSVDEEVVGKINASVITEKKALHLRASRAFTDKYGIERRAGEEWLVTLAMADSHIRDIPEELVAEVHITTLSNRQYCVVLDPYVEGVQRLGTRELRKGECSFFLHPGETLESSIASVHVLADDEALLLQAREEFNEELKDEDGKPAIVVRPPGVRWMTYGPREYIPPVQVDIIERRKAIPLDANEGIYVRDTKSGHVRAVIGETYMLSPTEILWEKDLPEEVDRLLGGKRIKTRVVTYQVAENCAVQVFDYKKKTVRHIFGPDMIMLMPDEQFSVVRLTGGWPKKEGALVSLCMKLGPDFMTDDIIVETTDHARLNLTLSYNWRFLVEDREKDGPKVFNVRDFVGDVIKTIASRVRGAVAGETFDNFHKNSAKIIREACLGKELENEYRTLVFKQNNLEISNVDIQSVEPVEEQTRASLQKSVQMAIEITTNSQEARARQVASQEEEEAKGLLEQQRLKNDAESEKTKQALLELRAESSAITSLGQAKAEAKARAEAHIIEGQAAVQQARLEAEAKTIQWQAVLEEKKNERLALIEYTRRMNELSIEKSKKMMEVELQKFKSQVGALGKETIEAIARAGPETQAKLLEGLGLKGFLITDGKNPVNLFNTASGMIANSIMSSNEQK